MNKKFYVHSNRESDFGRYDLALEPVKNKSTGYIFESKVATSKKEMDSLAKEALTQIDWKQYEVEFRNRGIQNIQKVGMVFYEKEMKISTN